MKTNAKKLKKEETEVIKNDMNDVITTSRQVRELLLDENISDAIKQEKLKHLRWVIISNKTIVSATNSKINCERFAK